MKRLLAAVFAAALVLVTPLTAWAQQSDSGSIRIVVVDVATKAPVELARVVLDGPVVTSEFTDKKGLVVFTDVPDGIYRARVVRRDYQMVTSASFEIINGNYVTVNVALALSTQLKVIGTVEAQSSAAISSSAFGPDSAVRKLSSDLSDALNKLSGVSVQTSSDDSDAEQTISLDGQDASQTALTLDGIPLNAPGSAGNLRNYATCLFAGAGVRNGPQLGGLAGGVNFTTLQPTLSWESYDTLMLGSNARNSWQAAETGSDGKLGVALNTCGGLATSWLDGLVYTDASGLDYAHNGDASSFGGSARFRYEINDSQSITGMVLTSNHITNIVCSRVQYNGIPCGYGPNNYSAGSVSLFSLTDDLLLGATSIQATFYGNNSTSLNDQLDRFVDGVASPIGSSGLNSSSGFTLNAILPAAQRHTISLTAYGSWGTSQTFPLNEPSVPYYTNLQRSSYAAAQITDSIHSNEHLSFSESLGLTQATGGFGGVLETLATTWHPTKYDTYTASYTMQGSPGQQTRSTILSDPAALRFTCDGDNSVAFGNAPGAAPEASSSTSTNLTYTRTWIGGDLAVRLYRQMQKNTLLPTDVNGSILLANGTISPAYVAAVQQVFQSSAGCGATTPFGATDLYFSSPVAGVNRLYQGVQVTGYGTFGNLIVQPFWNTTVSQAISDSPLIDNPYSITQSGQQLPNVPLQRAGVIFDYKARHSAIEYLADAEYYGRNNSNNLPAYTQFDAAINATFSKGNLTVAATNIFGTYAGIFSSLANAVPFYTQSGQIVPNVARPLTPRSYTVTYTIKYGPGALGNTHIAQSLPAQGGGGRGGGGGFRPQPLPSTAPANPLDVSSDGQRCPADAHATALQLSNELKAYVTQIEAAKTAAGYPATMAPPQISDASVTYHGMGSTYALTIQPHFAQAATLRLASEVLASPSPTPGPGSQGGQRGGGNRAGAGGGGGGLRVFFGCLTLHITQPDDVTAHNLYAPSSTVFGTPPITFMPSVGLYAVARQPQAGQESFRVYTLPSSPPKDPFEVRTAPECTADLKNAATEALTELRAYFANGTPPHLWTIAAHTAKNGTWYSLVPGDPTLVFSLLFCGRVAATTPAELVPKGWDGAMQPDLNYNAAYGIYLVRQPPRQPNPNASPGAGAPAPPPGP
jgi:TonB-dependent Receptor Plug Domain